MDRRGRGSDTERDPARGGAAAGGAALPTGSGIGGASLGVATRLCRFWRTEGRPGPAAGAGAPRRRGGAGSLREAATGRSHAAGGARGVGVRAFDAEVWARRADGAEGLRDRQV